MTTSIVSLSELKAKAAQVLAELQTAHSGALEKEKDRMAETGVEGRHPSQGPSTFEPGRPPRSPKGAGKRREAPPGTDREVPFTVPAVNPTACHKSVIG